MLDLINVNLVDVRAEELLALELDGSRVAGLGTPDFHFAAEFYPRYRQDTPAVSTGKRGFVLLVMFQQVDHAFSDVVHCHLKQTVQLE